MSKLLRVLLVLGSAVLLISGAAFAQDPAPEINFDPNAITLDLLADGFFRPNGLFHAGDGSGRLFVMEQGGRVWILQPDGTREPIPFLDLTDLVSPSANDAAAYTERGLLGLAFHPDYEENGYLYVNYTNRNGNTVIARYTVSESDPNLADLTTEQIMIVQEQPYANHNGGWMEFGPDGYLYISLGDGGSAGDPLGNGQNLNSILGKILRIDVNVEGAQTYGIPEDNPFVNVAGARPEIWAYGLRNAWRNGFDMQTGDLYIADVGQAQWEEVNFQPADSTGGENYGWSPYEGTHSYSGAPLPEGAVMPFTEYSHSEGVSITGGYVYRGSEIEGLNGVYFYGDFGYGTIWSAYSDEAGVWQVAPFKRQTGILISSFGQDENGELYVIDYDGAVWRFNG